MDISWNYKRLKQWNYLVSEKRLIDKNKNAEKVASLEKVEVLYTFNTNKSYPYLLNVEPSNLVFFKCIQYRVWCIIITFTDQLGRPLEIENKVSLTLLINK